MARKDRGELKCTKAEARFARALAGVDLRGRGDGLVHFGDSVMLMNQATNGCVAVDMEEWKLETLCDLYETLTITQAIIYVNARRKVNAEWGCGAPGLASALTPSVFVGGLVAL